MLVGCKFYSFTGASIPEGAETVQVNMFVNNAANSIGSTFEAGLDRDFTNALQEVLINQTNLQLTGVDGDLIYEGEIEEYMCATYGNQRRHCGQPTHSWW
jgi:hypothetical protein